MVLAAVHDGARAQVLVCSRVHHGGGTPPNGHNLIGYDLVIVIKGYFAVRCGVCVGLPGDPSWLALPWQGKERRQREAMYWEQSSPGRRGAQSPARLLPLPCVGRRPRGSLSSAGAAWDLLKVWQGALELGGLDDIAHDEIETKRGCSAMPVRRCSEPYRGLKQLGFLHAASAYSSNSATRDLLGLPQQVLFMRFPCSIPDPRGRHLLAGRALG